MFNTPFFNFTCKPCTMSPNQNKGEILKAMQQTVDRRDPVKASALKRRRQELEKIKDETL